MSHRILIVSPFPPLLGGVSVSSERLYNNLKEDGYDVEKYNIIKFGHNPLLKIIVFLWIPFFILLKKKYDIIHFHVPSKARKIYVAFFKPLYKGAKVVFTLYGDETVYNLIDGNGYLLQNIGDKEEQIERLKEFISLSQEEKNAMGKKSRSNILTRASLKNMVNSHLNACKQLIGK